jgi:hypothetical protein
VYPPMYPDVPFKKQPKLQHVDIYGWHQSKNTNELLWYLSLLICWKLHNTFTAGAEYFQQHVFRVTLRSVCVRSVRGLVLAKFCSAVFFISSRLRELFEHNFVRGILTERNRWFVQPRGAQHLSRLSEYGRAAVVNCSSVQNLCCQSAYSHLARNKRPQIWHVMRQNFEPGAS